MGYTLSYILVHPEQDQMPPVFGTVKPQICFRTNFPIDTLKQVPLIR
jgi:hypothetical protein